MYNVARCNAYQGHCNLCKEENGGSCPNEIEEEKVYTVSGTMLEDVDGEWMDIPFGEEFDTFDEMKEFVLRHKKDLYLTIDEILDPDGNDIDVL